MNLKRNANPSAVKRTFDARLAGYLTAAGAATAVFATDAKAIVVGNNTVQPFGINGAVNIDFNHDGQTDYQIDHDRVDLTAQGGPVVDYLQLDKNDVNGASPGESPLPINALTNFPLNSTAGNDNGSAAYVVQNVALPTSIEYPSALPAGAQIGPLQNFDFQEGTNVQSTNKTGRFNRLIDEDHGQVDQLLGGLSPSQIAAPTGSPNFLGTGGAVRYLGVKMELNGTDQINYGWIGVRITNDADATGEVVGYAYETTPNTAITAGNVPEPTSLCSALFGGIAVFGFLCKRLRRR